MKIMEGQHQINKRMTQQINNEPLYSLLVLIKNKYEHLRYDSVTFLFYCFNLSTEEKCCKESENNYLIFVKIISKNVKDN